MTLSGCSRKKDKFINRNWHSLNTKYNILYNGNLAFDAGLKDIEDDYKDNYWKILPIERLSISEDLFSDSQAQNPNFERAEEKAVKAVQKHGMNIKGKEKNPQIDDAYILLGKARYYSGRFIPALEAFNYILFKYPGSSNINLAKIWRAKTNLRLENETTALENLKALIEKNELSKIDQVEAQATLAQAYLNTNKIDSALLYLKKANSITKNKFFKGRLHFIEGQLYNKLGKKDSANMAFQEVIELKRSVPQAYRVNAFLEQIHNFDYSSGDREVLSGLLSDIEENREHRPYLDRIHHTIAKHHIKQDNDSLAIVYFNKSLRTKSDDNYLNALNYHTIADLYFDESRYTDAGKYYDSTLLNYKPNSKPFRAVKKRLDNLQDVIYYESIAQTNDSILGLVAMPEEEQEQYFEELIVKLKEEQEKKVAKQKTLVNPTSSFNASKAKKSGAFYFYQTATVAYGKNEFANTWGKRPLVDNWRWSKQTVSDAISKPIASKKGKESLESILDVRYYMNQIPTDPKQIDSITKERNFSYYQLGLIYKNKFKDYSRSKDKLEALLSQNPEERLVLPAKYNLYKVYTILSDTSLAEVMKESIIRDYPTSRYAKILKNPAAVLGKDAQGPEARYNVLFEKFEASQYQEVIDSCTEEIIRFEGDEIIPKFELLKTSAKGRLYGFKDYKEGLNYIALNYPNAPEGKQAQDLIDNVLSTLEDDTFEELQEGQHFKTIYQFDVKEQDLIDPFIEELTKVIEEEDVLRLRISQDVFNINTIFVVVHGLKSINGAQGFAELLDVKSNKLLARPYFAISSKNYKKLQIHKTLDQYLEKRKN
jgi:tetratricopeptide (TPR) repeat protein